MSRIVKNILIKVALAGGLLLGAHAAFATDVAYSGTFVGTEGLAKKTGQTASATYTRDMNTTGDRVSFQITSSSYSVAVSTTFTSSNYTLNTPTITITSNNFVTGLQVLYTTGTVAISGLSNGTTYYVSVIRPNATTGLSSTFKLASSLANAQAGTGIVLASSSTSANVYTLAPLAFTNTTGGGILLQWSDDNANWTSATTGNYGLAITSVTFTAAGGTVLYDLGFIQHRYLRAAETPPTTGAMTYTCTDNERYSFKH